MSQNPDSRLCIPDCVKLSGRWWRTPWPDTIGCRDVSLRCEWIYGGYAARRELSTNPTKTELMPYHQDNCTRIPQRFSNVEFLSVISDPRIIELRIKRVLNSMEENICKEWGVELRFFQHSQPGFCPILFCIICYDGGAPQYYPPGTRNIYFCTLLPII